MKLDDRSGASLGSSREHCVLMRRFVQPRSASARARAHLRKSLYLKAFEADVFSKKAPLQIAGLEERASSPALPLSFSQFLLI
jgi:hypothetical protein